MVGLSVAVAAVLALLVGSFGVVAGAMVSARITRRHQLAEQDTRADQLRSSYADFLATARHLEWQATRQGDGPSIDQLTALRQALAPLEITAPDAVLTAAHRSMAAAQRVVELDQSGGASTVATKEARTNLATAVNETSAAMRADLLP